MKAPADILTLISELKERKEPFALATVVRTVSATAAKAGAKAIITRDGTFGWIGGGCARAAVLKAAQEVLEDGQARLVSIQPPDLLDEQGVKPGESRAGISFARNMCPSQGTMDIFIEAVLPRPSLVICGSSPVAVALANLGSAIGFEIAVCAPVSEQKSFEIVDRRLESPSELPATNARQYVVVATQGRGDEAAMRAALTMTADYRGFVGSRRKSAKIRDKLLSEGIPSDRLETIKGPAGLDIGGITPEEIALSILAEITKVRRRGQRGG